MEFRHARLVGTVPALVTEPQRSFHARCTRFMGQPTPRRSGELANLDATAERLHVVQLEDAGPESHRVGHTARDGTA